MADALHPTAIIDPRARLGEGVQVGAFSIVGPEVALGDGVELGHHVVIEGSVTIGAHAKIGHGSVIGGRPQDLKFKDGTPSAVRIGARTILREYVTVHRATTPGAVTEIGSDCLLMSASHVAHDCRLGDGVIIINVAGVAGHCDIGDRATIGGLAGLHPFTRVGTHAYIGGLAKVVSDVPPFVLADGVPATARGINVIGLRRAGMPPAERRALQAAFRLLYRSGLGPGRALERIRSELPASAAVATLVQFIAGSKRGIVGASRREEGTGNDVPSGEADIPRDEGES
jgi:UDP-N-acetylglucosamine acyltransferase